MEQKQSFNLTTDLLNGFSSTFMKFVYAIILVYLIILILNFLRDKFINTQVDSKKDDIIEIMTILSKLFFVSGFGFIIGNALQILFTENNRLPMMNLTGDWNYLVFGIIIIFIGLGLQVAKKVMLKERNK